MTTSVYRLAAFSAALLAAASLSAPAKAITTTYNFTATVTDSYGDEPVVSEIVAGTKIIGSMRF